MNDQFFFQLRICFYKWPIRQSMEYYTIKLDLKILFTPNSKYKKYYNNLLFEYFEINTILSIFI